MSRHNKENLERIRELERNPLTDVVAADLTDRYQDPDTINGHRPDYVAKSVFGQTIIGETERRGDNSQHAQSQEDAFSKAAEDPLTSFEENLFGSDDQNDIFSFF